MREGVVSGERREDEEREEEEGVVRRLGRDESLVRRAGEEEREGLSERFNSSAQFGPYILSNQSDNLLSLVRCDKGGSVKIRRIWGSQVEEFTCFAIDLILPNFSPLLSGIHLWERPVHSQSTYRGSL